MATFMNTECVKYQFKGISAHLSELSFCRHCLELKSKQCVLHEVDSLFCPNCLESMPSGEAKMKKNRCATCFDCPCCGHALSTRATTLLQETPKSGENPEGTAGENPGGTARENPGELTRVPKKAFYLACSYCRWTSRDVHIKDQFVASGGWTDQVNPHAARISSLIEHYKQMTMNELQEKERKDLRRKSYFVDKVGMTQLSFKRRAGFSLKLIKEQGEMHQLNLEASKTADSCEQVPDHYYTQAPNLTAVTTIQQRHSSPEFQPVSVDQLYPQRKHLLIKRSQRCKGCDHNLSKPEFNPSAIKFKIQLVAIHHIPELRILSLPLLKANQPTRITLTINNPLETLLRILLSAPDDDVGTNGGKDGGGCHGFAKIDLPLTELQIAKCDEAAEMDVSPSYDDDPGVIAYRKGNKIGFYVTITPLGGERVVQARLKLRHNYVKKVLPVGDAKEDEFLWLEHVIILNFGVVEGGVKGEGVVEGGIVKGVVEVKGAVEGKAEVVEGKVVGEEVEG